MSGLFYRATKNDFEIKIVFNGVGAANFAIQRLLGKAGFNTEKALYCDSRGIIYKEREDVQSYDNYKYEIAQISNPEQIRGDCGKAMEGADVLISLSKSLR